MKRLMSKELMPSSIEGMNLLVGQRYPEKDDQNHQLILHICGWNMTMENFMKKEKNIYSKTK